MLLSGYADNMVSNQVACAVGRMAEISHQRMCVGVELEGR